MRVRPEHAVVAAALGLALGCTPDPRPLPHGYFRIDLPPVAYTVHDAGCYTAEVPAAVHVRPRQAEGQRCWSDLDYGPYKARVHLTYRTVNGDLDRLIEDAHILKRKHELKAARIRTEVVHRDSARVHGTIFDVEGDVASPMVFYVTDSSRHFLYGALYFLARPNADSLAPVTDRVRADMRHFVGSLRWNGPSGGVDQGQQHAQQ
ncbi:MAG: hypothetical protein IT228_04755 [Flavobacteriales bacterium]|nr:hypothetical protein [Flavobacteriales bacterium]MCC6576634.1 hypothetical protein [Flavobacteriales bacterium]NUQ15114.1 hypothetical protein [Flavobacteriales bacterium]